MTASDRQFHTIFEYSPVGMIILDSSGHIQYVNRAACTILGRAEHKLHAEALYRFLHDDDVDLFIEQSRDLVSDGRYPLQTTVRVVHIDGTESWCRMNFSYVSSQAASPFVFGLIEDVTEQRRGQERLRREKEIAERATRTKSAFLANMSHEIRTPIHTVTGMSELLMETSLDPEQREYGEQIQFAAEVLLGLINDILDFSKIEAGKLNLEVIEFDLIKTIQEAVDMVSLEAHKKGLDVVLDLEPGLPQVIYGDPVRLRQVIVNLFNNAVKFTNVGEIAIEGRRAPSAGRQALVVRVIDTGEGIAEDKINRLFKPFSQVDPSTTRKFGGTGLGLSISRSLIEMMHGRIGVQSREGEGSAFWFTIPFDEVGDAPYSVAAPETLQGRSVRALLVDDNARTRRTIGEYLSRWGVEVDYADSGERGLEMLKSASESGLSFDLVLVDAILPGIDGWQLASEINSSEIRGQTRLILMSPTGIMGGEAKMKLLNWFDAYVNKPVKWADLGRSIETAFVEVAPVADADEEEVADLESLQPVDELSGATGGSRVRSGTSERVGSVASDESTSSAVRAGKVLVAEDHAVNQQLFRTILEKTGQIVAVADNGVEAVEKALEFQPDIVFMDIQMPRMNGYEAARRLRDQGFTAPIVAVTANAHAGEREKCLDYGMDDYMAKPFKPFNVRELLERWLDSSDRARADRSRRNASEGGFGSRSEPVFDYSGALESFMGKADVVDRVMTGFLEKLHTQRDELRTALDAGKIEDVRSIAHSIKGGALSLEAVRLGMSAARLEDAAAREETDHLELLFSTLRENIEELEVTWNAQSVRS